MASVPLSVDPRIVPAEQYFNISTGTLNPEQFGMLVSKKVTMIHFTNGVKDGEAQGRTNTVNAYNVNLFSNTSGIIVTGKPVITIGPNNTVNLAFIVCENKTKDNVTTRFCFSEGTTFGVKKREHSDEYKITSITSYVIRQEVSS